MPLKTLFDLIVIEGKTAADIRENKPSLTSSLVVLLAGLIYGLVVFYFKSEAIIGELNYYYLIFIVLFGFLYMVASQIGLTLLLWAMSRILKGSPKFMALFSAVGYSFLPYGVLASVVTYYNIAPFNRLLLVLVISVCILALIYTLTKTIHIMEGFSLKKSFISVVFCLIFFVSFIYVFGY